MHAQEYAQALFELKPKTAHEQSSMVKNLVALLNSKGHEKLLPRIVAEYERLLERAHMGGVQVTVADETSRKEALHKAHALAETYNVDTSSIRVTEDDHLIKGYAIEGPGFRYDASARGSLLSLYRHLKN